MPSTNVTNWRDPDHSQWSFRNVDKIFPTAPIKTGSKTSPLPSNPRNFDDFRIQAPNKPALDLPSFLSSTETDGLIVLKDGEVVYESYDRGNDASSVHIMMSMTKSVTGLLCGILAEQGRLDLDATIPTYVPEVKGTAYEGVTIRQCLDMRAGIKYDDASPDYRAAAGWGPPESESKPANLHDFLAAFHAPPLPEVEGLGTSQFEYVSVNTDLMGWVLERASGQKFAELVSELIWKPLGAERDAYITLDPAGNARPAGGMCATLRDIARLGQLVLKDGDGIVPPTWIEDMLHGGSEEAFAAGAWKGFERVLGKLAYRSYWVANGEEEVLMGMGVHGQLLMVDRRRGLVMAKMSSQAQRVEFGKTALGVLAFREFGRLLEGEVNGEVKG